MAFKSQIVGRCRSYLSLATNTFVLRREHPYCFILVLNDKCNLNCFYCESKNTGRYDLDWVSERNSGSGKRGDARHPRPARARSASGSLQRTLSKLPRHHTDHRSPVSYRLGSSDER